jgi:hypothetical protein
MMTGRTSRRCGTARFLEEHAHIVLLTRIQAELPRSVQVDVLLGFGSLECKKPIFDHLTALMLEPDYQQG